MSLFCGLRDFADVALFLDDFRHPLILATWRATKAGLIQ